jgi:hypothetical protein
LDVLLTLPRSFWTRSVTVWEPGVAKVCVTDRPDTSIRPSPSKSQSSRTIGLGRDDVDVNVIDSPADGLGGL